MPYVNPIYNNGTSPALNATNMNAVCDEVVRLGGVATTLTSSVNTLSTDVDALETAVAGLTPHIESLAAPTTLTVADNHTYVLTNVQSCTLSYPAGNFHCYIRFTTASSGTVTSAIVLPAATKKSGDIPTYANSKTYDCDILCVGGISAAVIVEVVA